MKLSDMPKPLVTPPPIPDAAAGEDFTDIAFELIPTPGVTEHGTDDSDEGDFEAELVQAVDIIRQSHNWLGFFYQLDSQQGLLGAKASESMHSFIQDVEDFLGDYQP